MGACIISKQQPAATVQPKPSSPRVSEGEAVGVIAGRRRLSLSQSAAAVVDGEAIPRGQITAVSPLAPGEPPPFEMSKEPPLSPKPEQTPVSVPTKQRKRLSITGVVASDIVQDTFEDKREQVTGEGWEEQDHDLGHLGIGYVCKKGLKPESPNQDDFFILRVDEWGLYGVFDGHGPMGHDVSNYVQRHLPAMIMADESFDTHPTASLKRTFREVHRMLEVNQETSELDCSLSGTTASVALFRPLKNKLVVAHVGDSRMVLAKRNGTRLTAVDVTVDHKPNNEEERKRIINSGGQVRRLEGDIPHRVFLKGKLYPGLAMSRAIGDCVGNQVGVIPDPDVDEIEVHAGLDEFIVIASDGVWEFVSSQEAVDMVDSYGPARVQEAADELAKESWHRWIEEEGCVVDDITIEIIYLFHGTEQTK